MSPRARILNIFTHHHPRPLSSLRPSLAPLCPFPPRQWHDTYPSALRHIADRVACRGRRLCCHHRPPPVDNSPPLEPETQKDSEPTDLFAFCCRWAPSPYSSTPAAVSAATATCDHIIFNQEQDCWFEEKAEPHATYTTPQNLYLAVYALDVGGSTAEFSERWKALEQEKPPSALFQAYDKYSKELKKASAPQPSLEDIRKHIYMVMGTSAAV
ncbi:hypothetical protein B0H14DRAFT_3710467 [Mycena olivaceomarginata]|nr:hypothetical protein B0H14DRAFT_3710467 [Mycena olivaceomarginata]